MADLPEPSIPTDQDFGDHLDVMDALGTPSTGGTFLEEQIAREEMDRTAIDALQALREIQSTEPVRWSIERLEGEGSPGLLTKWPSSLLKWERVRDEFGSGTYRVEGRTLTGKYVGRRTITIASDAPRKVKDSMTAASSFNLSEFMAAQESRDRQRRLEDQERRRAEEERERSREERDEKRRQERNTLILGALPSVATVLAAAFGNRADPLAIAAALRPPAPPDPIAAIAALKSLMPEASKGPTPIEQSLQLVELLLDKAGDSGKTQILDVVKEGVKILGPTIGGAIEQTIVQARLSTQSSSQQFAPVQPVAPGQSADSAAEDRRNSHPSTALPGPQSPPSFNGDPAMLDLLPHLPWLREQLSRCANAAARQRDPQLYAAMFLEELPEGLTVERVAQLLNAPDWFAQLSRFDARIGAQGPWWAALRREVLVYIQEVLTPKTHPAQSSGEIQRPTAPPSLMGDPTA
jgi:hypothetical protein